jgi:hypothetical protein
MVTLMAKPSNGTRPVQTDERRNVIREMLQATPLDRRAEIIVEIFQIIAQEFAAMVLENVKPERRTARHREFVSKVGVGSKPKRRAR